MPHGATGTANNTAAKRAGSANFSCNDGALSYVSGTCVYVPSNCSGTAVWGACSTGGVNLLHGASTNVNASSGGIGSAQVTCNDGNFNYSGTSCAANCSNQNISWTVGGNTCSGSTGSGNHGQTKSVGNSAAERNGSANFRCNNGNWNYQSGSCTVVFSGCSATTITRGWDGNRTSLTTGSYCRYDFPMLNNGESAVAGRFVSGSAGIACWSGISSLRATCSNGTLTYSNISPLGHCNCRDGSR